MASTTKKHDWLVILPDRADVGDNRKTFRAGHVGGLAPRIDSGFWRLGGAMLAKPVEEGEERQVVGSCIIAHAATKEEVLDDLKADIFWKEVWDLEKIQVIPFFHAFGPGSQ